ncbi:ABC transporter ATP-binding protein [Salinisphaera sp. LB1]|uniref:ABC transporter ATP-binding protein n=1 Tax=Salinisphaera sp. LB1 TaxID=2183911 RepID=UPI000D7076AC|nr:ATP-binding cassette domain-containing protein [Salinisphaera sp. LB1]AWN16159.1 Methionine ABC transporter ATP-binding protein [Salinisphaera sp. LB1]
MTADRQAQSQPAVEVNGLGAKIGKRWILRGLDLRVEQGETLAVIGGSGSGKSLTLRHLIGLNEPDEGRVDVLGVPLWHLNQSRMRQLSRHWGVLFQQGALFSSLPVFANIAFPMRELRRDGLHMPESMITDLVSLKLAAVGLDPDVGNQMPDALSGGMIKRVALARALALDPELLFLDEPTAGLDPASSTDFHQLYKHLHKDMGLSGLIVTHDRSTLASVADRVAILDEGRILTVGTLDEVRRVSHPFIERFFADDNAVGAAES